MEHSHEFKRNRHETFLESSFSRHEPQASGAAVNCPLIDDRFRRNIVKMAVEPRAVGEWFLSKL